MTGEALEMGYQPETTVVFELVDIVQPDSHWPCLPLSDCHKRERRKTSAPSYSYGTTATEYRVTINRSVYQSGVKRLAAMRGRDTGFDSLQPRQRSPGEGAWLEWG